MASFLHLAVIDTRAPGIDPAANPADPLPHLVLRIAESGLHASCTKDACAPVTLEQIDGGYDWIGLNRALAIVKNEAPRVRLVVIAADDAVRTDDIVAALDATRNCLPVVRKELPDLCVVRGPSGRMFPLELFPDATFSTK